MVAPIDITADTVKYSPDNLAFALQNTAGMQSFLSTLQSIKSNYVTTNNGTVPAPVVANIKQVIEKAYTIAATTGGVTA